MVDLRVTLHALPTELKVWHRLQSVAIYEATEAPVYATFGKPIR